jgi:hypothetical protein
LTTVTLIVRETIPKHGENTYNHMELKREGKKPSGKEIGLFDQHIDD